MIMSPPSKDWEKELAKIDNWNVEKIESSLKTLAQKLGWKITHILNTHHHLDHVGGVGVPVHDGAIPCCEGLAFGGTDGAAREDEVDTAGDTPWQDDRWNVRFMQKLDRMFSDANDQGMYLFVKGLVNLFWDRSIPNYERLVEMIGARYAAHFVSFASSMDDPYDPLHEQLNAAIARALQAPDVVERFTAIGGH